MVEISLTVAHSLTITGFDLDGCWSFRQRARALAERLDRSLSHHPTRYPAVWNRCAAIPRRRKTAL